MNQIAPAPKSFDWGTEFSGRQVSTTLGRLYTVDLPRTIAAPDRGVAVFIHGFGDSHFTFKRLMQYVSDLGFRVVAFNFLNRLQSDERPAGRHFDANFYVEQVNALLSSLGLGDTPVGLIGHSMGGLISCLFANKYPERVSWMSLTSPAGLFNKPLMLSIVKMLPKFMVRSAFGGIKSQRDVWRKSVTPDLHDTPYYHAFLEQQENQFKQIGRDGVPTIVSAMVSTARSFDLTKSANETVLRAVGSHPRPVLLLWGDADSILPGGTDGSAPRYREAFPKAEHHVIEHSGHACFNERPEAALPLIGAFLTRVTS
mmetsp:Transcript_27769/g.63998  ORF Transcript_27769/g.63998 Transcript_27769/m.63998 type:complete len:313 (-) Transcript_27769:18-956(-)